MKESTLRVCHTIDNLSVSSGGPSRTVTQLATALARLEDVGVNLITQQFENAAFVAPEEKSVRLVVAQTSSRFVLRSGTGMRRAVDKLCRAERPSIIHNHGIWLPTNHWAVSSARKYGIPLVIHPRGMLEPWAIGHKGLKKRLAMAVFQRRDIKTAAAIVATSVNEYKNIRAMGFRQPIAIIPNGISFDKVIGSTLPNPDKRERVVLFLSRLHPVKGLVNLVTAWARLNTKGWKLKIAGPDEGGHGREVLALIEKLDIRDTVELVGEVEGEKKQALYKSADLFVLPTFSENFGVVVAEALSYGLPVITTKGAPWQDLETYQCGWWVDIGVEPLVAALKEAMTLSGHQREAMGKRGQAYVQSYNWSDIAHQTVNVYRWLLGRADKPDCLYLE